MRILHTVEFYHPSVGGAQEVVRRVSEGLVQRGHEVTVATTQILQRRQNYINGVRVVQFPISGNIVRGLVGPIKDYQDFLLTGNYDIMMNYAAQQWATDLVFPVLSQLRYRKILSPCGFSGLHSAQYVRYFERMPEILRSYDHIIFHSNTYQDVRFSRDNEIVKYSMIPNGASESEFEAHNIIFRDKYSIPKGSPLLLTVGSHTGLKGHRLVIGAFRRAGLSKPTLVIIGNTPDGASGCLKNCKRHSRLVTTLSLGSKRILLLNPPRAEVVAAYQAADLFVFGSSIECSPLVLFEAMASRTPFVTVACGNAEEIAQWGQGGLIIPTIQGRSGFVTADPTVMGKAITRLMLNKHERHQMAEAGYNAWRQRFTWGHIIDQYENLYQNVVAGRSGSSVV